MLKYGPMSYHILIVAEADSLLPATAEAIAKFVECEG